MALVTPPIVKSFFETMKEYVGIPALIIGVMTAVGIAVIPPWAARADLTKVEKAIETEAKERKEVDTAITVKIQGLLEAQIEQNIVSLQTQRFTIRREVESTEEEMRANPDSRSLARRLQELKDQLGEIDDAIKKNRNRQDGDPHPCSP